MAAMRQGCAACLPRSSLCLPACLMFGTKTLCCYNGSERFVAEKGRLSHLFGWGKKQQFVGMMHMLVRRGIMGRIDQPQGTPMN